MPSSIRPGVLSGVDGWTSDAKNGTLATARQSPGKRLAGAARLRRKGRGGLFLRRRKGMSGVKRRRCVRAGGRMDGFPFFWPQGTRCRANRAKFHRAGEKKGRSTGGQFYGHTKKSNARGRLAGGKAEGKRTGLHADPGKQMRHPARRGLRLAGCIKIPRSKWWRHHLRKHHPGITA